MHNINKMHRINTSITTTIIMCFHLPLNEAPNSIHCTQNNCSALFLCCSCYAMSTTARKTLGLHTKKSSSGTFTSPPICLNAAKLCDLF